MMIIPIQALPNQSFQVQLGNQSCTIEIIQSTYGLFCNLFIGNVLIIGGVICLNLVRIVRSLYLGFSGDLCFIDTQGATNPVYTGLGSRYLLAYLTPDDLGVGAGAGIPSASPPLVTTPVNLKGTFTLNPNATTTVVLNSAVIASSVIVISPTDSDAANDMATTSIVCGQGQFTVTHANNARSDRTFNYIVIL